MAKMPHSQKWQQSLSKSFCDSRAYSLIAKAQTYYSDYCAQHSAEKNHAHKTILRTRVLPGLSIYKALREENIDQEKSLYEVAGLFKAIFFIKRMQGIRLLNYFPNPFFIIKPVLKMMFREEYMVGAQQIVEDNVDCFAVNVYRCFILDTLTKYNAEELTALYCDTDDWLAEVLPKISWQRTKTLGRGNDCCNFRWCRIK